MCIFGNQKHLSFMFVVKDEEENGEMKHRADLVKLDLFTATNVTKVE